MGLTVTSDTPRTVVHANSNGISTAFPDVCKTPTPGGPVPIPYPNIALSKHTSQGSKKVKMDGNPIMLKNSSFSMSTGDEAGSAGGGVVSSKIKGKAKFVNYSFDVKVEGKNVPRMLDPMQQNGNTSNTFSPVVMQPPKPVREAQIGTIECEEHWDCCQRAQAQAKVKMMNESLRKTKGGWKKINKDVAPAIYESRRLDGNYFAFWFKREILEQTHYEGGREWRKGMAPKFKESDFLHPCAFKDWKKGNQDYSADHVRDIQYGGHPQGPLKMFDTSINQAFGSKVGACPSPLKWLEFDCPADDECKQDTSVRVRSGYVI